MKNGWFYSLKEIFSPLPIAQTRRIWRMFNQFRRLKPSVLTSADSFKRKSRQEISPANDFTDKTI
jgi:hypothetical protein